MHSNHIGILAAQHWWEVAVMISMEGRPENQVIAARVLPFLKAVGPDTERVCKQGIFSIVSHVPPPPAFCLFLFLSCVSFILLSLCRPTFSPHGQTQQLQLQSLSQLYVIFKFKHNREKWISLKLNFKSWNGVWYVHFGSSLAVHKETGSFHICVLGIYVEEIGR